MKILKKGVKKNIIFDGDWLNNSFSTFLILYLILTWFCFKFQQPRPTQTGWQARFFQLCKLLLSPCDKRNCLSACMTHPPAFVTCVLVQIWLRTALHLDWHLSEVAESNRTPRNPIIVIQIGDDLILHSILFFCTRFSAHKHNNFLLLLFRTLWARFALVLRSLAHGGFYDYLFCLAYKCMCVCVYFVFYDYVFFAQNKNLSLHCAFPRPPQGRNKNKNTRLDVLRVVLRSVYLPPFLVRLNPFHV